MIRLYFFACSLVLILASVMVSCSKTDGHAYKKYMKNGEIIYPGRPDSVIVQSGQNRLKLSIALGNDPSVSRVVVYWSNDQDSLEAPVTQLTGKDTIKLLIPGLTEGNYNFTVYTYDKTGHRSVPVNAFGMVYGPHYIGALTNRRLRSVVPSEDGTQVLLNWGTAASGEAGIDITYTGTDGTPQHITATDKETQTTLSTYKEGSTFTYRSRYKPDSTAFEYFYPEATASAMLPVFERQLPKANFKIYALPTDIKDNWGWLLPYLWDNNYGTPGFATQEVVPSWFTIDCGTTAALSRFKMWQASDRLYKDANVRTFELYGSNNPAGDGSWASWTKIGAYESLKPSGLPLGQTSETDIAFALEGEAFIVPGGTPAFRYYRFKLLTNWENKNYMTIGEVTFYTHDR